MRLRLIAALLGLAWSGAALAQPSPAGLWWTENGSGIIAIAPCDEGLCGHIVGQPHPRDASGHMPVDIHGAPHCGLQILHGEPAAEPGHWRGVITDPDDGQDWHCEFWVADDGSLRLRGYVLLEMFGKTQVWPKFQGSVAADCSINPPS